MINRVDDGTTSFINEKINGIPISLDKEYHIGEFKKCTFYNGVSFPGYSYIFLDECTFDVSSYHGDVVPTTLSLVKNTIIYGNKIVFNISERNGCRISIGEKNTIFFTNVYISNSHDEIFLPTMDIDGVDNKIVFCYYDEDHIDNIDKNAKYIDIIQNNNNTVLKVNNF